MKLKKSIVITLILALVSLFAIVGCSPKPTPDPEPAPEPDKPAATITLDRTKAELDVYEKLVLTATKENTDADIVWSTSDESVATVSDGTVTAKAEGSVTITAKADGASATCEITVTNSHAAPVLRLERYDVAVAMDGSYDIKVETLWKGAPIDEEVEYVWTVADGKPADIAAAEIIDGGARIKGLKYGETVLVVSANVRGTMLVKELAVKVCNLDITFEVTGLKQDADAYRTSVALVDTESDSTVRELDIKVYNKGTLVENAAIEWTNSDDGKATIEGNTVTAVAEGETTLVGTYEYNDIRIIVDVYRPEIRLGESVTIETALDANSFTIASDVAGTIRGASVDGKEISSSIDGKTVTYDKAKLPTKAADMGDKEIIVDTDKAIYIIDAKIYTKVLRTADDVMKWNDYAYDADPEKSYWGGYFVLGDDIDMTGKNFVGRFYYLNMYYPWNYEIEALRDTVKPEYSPLVYRNGNTGGFRGVFDGQGHKIKNLNISQPNDSFVGQIAVGGVFKNVVFTGARITTDWGAGLVSVGGNGTIANVYAEITEMHAGNTNDDKNGIFYSQDTMSGAKVNNCMAVFNCETPADPSRFTGLGSYRLGYGILNGVYAIGLDSSLAIRTISSAGAGDVYGAYSGYGALYESAVGLTSWDNDFWRVVNGVPYPKTLELPTSATPNAKVDEYVGIGTQAIISGMTSSDVIRLSDEARALGVTASGNRVTVPASVPSGTAVSLTVYNIFDTDKSVDLTFRVVESKSVKLDGKHSVVIEDGATFTVDFGDKKDDVEGELNVATIDGKTFTTANYSNGVLTLDTATLKSLYGEKYMTVTFMKKNGSVTEKVTVVEIDLDVTTMVIRTEADLNRFLTVAQENKIGASWAGIYKLANDITCTGDYSGISGSGDPRGALGTATGFNGTFDGQGHTIYNINIVGAQTGFASHLGQHGVIKNVAFVNARNRGAGGFITSIQAGTIENVYIQLAENYDVSEAGWCPFNSSITADSYGQGRINKVFVEYVTALDDTAKTGYPMYNFNKGYGIVNGVYAVGVSKFTVGGSGNPGDVYGVYADYAALKAAAVDFTAWDNNGFWKVVNGIPVPKNFTAKATLSNTELGVAAGATVALGSDDTYVTIAIDAAAKEAGFKLVGRKLIVPEDAAGKSVTVTVTSALDDTVKAEKTFTVITTEIKNVADVTEIDMTATGNITFDLSAQNIDGDLVGATIDGTAFASTAYEAGTLTLDRSALGSLYGEKTIVATFEKRNGGTLEKVTTVNIPVVLVTKYITEKEHLVNLKNYAVKLNDTTYGGYFVQTQDIDVENTRVGMGYWGGDNAGWLDNFTGTYDGRGHVVANANQGVNSGFIANATGATTIKNIVFTGAIVSGPTGFVMTSGSENTVIENIAVYGKITAGGAFWSPASMLLGKGDKVTVRNCMVVLTDWNLDSGICAGMLVGNRVNVNIKNCIAVNLKPGATEAEYAIPAIGENNKGLENKANDTDTVKTCHGWDEYLAWAADKDMSAYGNSTWEVLENKIPVAKSAKASVGAVNADFMPDTVAVGETNTINITNAGMYAKVTVEPAVEGVTVGFSTITVADTFNGTFTVKVTSLVTGESVTKTVTGTTTTTLTGKHDLGINNDNTLDISEAGVTGTVKSARVGDTAVTASLDGTTLSVTGLVDSLGQTVYGDKTLSVVIEKADNSLATVNVPVLVVTKILKTADDILGWNELSYAADAAGNYWGGYFVLGNDIDMQGKNFRGCYTYSDLYPGDKLKEGFEGFQWLNGNSGGFRGVFDGRGHAISNLTMSKWCDSFLGLLAAQGTIKNIAFTNVTLAGSTSVIALGGCGRIENAYVEIAAYSNGNAVDSTGIFLARDCMGSARLVNCFVKFNCATTVTGGFNGLGKYHLGYGILKNVYAVGEGMTKDTVIRILSNTNAGGDVYGGYADAAAFAAEVTVSAENGWDMDFWTTTADGLPIPKTLNA